jgi:fatty acid desaturase
MSNTDTEQEASRSPEYEAARRRVERRRKFRADIVAYVLINAFLVVVWAATGSGYFWPGWVIGGWGVFLLIDAWNTFYRRPVTESDVEGLLQV